MEYFTMSRPRYMGVMTPEYGLLIECSIQGTDDNEAGRKIDLWTARIQAYKLRAQHNWTIEKTEELITDCQSFYLDGYNSGIFTKEGKISKTFKGNIYNYDNYVRLVKPAK